MVCRAVFAGDARGVRTKEQINCSSGGDRDQQGGKEKGEHSCEGSEWAQRRRSLGGRMAA
jgi:hypothetical protein